MMFFALVAMSLWFQPNPAHAQALFQSDVIVLVLRLDFTSLRQASRILAYLKRLGIARENVRLVANRYRQARELRPAELEKAIGMKIEHYIRDDSSSINLASNKGVPVVLERPNCKPSRSLYDLAVSVNGHRPE
jgi:Flp pilus assembly CpaE family ATPase